MYNDGKGMLWGDRSRLWGCDGTSQEGWESSEVCIEASGWQELWAAWEFGCVEGYERGVQGGAYVKGSVPESISDTVIPVCIRACGETEECTGLQRGYGTALRAGEEGLYTYDWLYQTVGIAWKWILEGTLLQDIRKNLLHFL